MCLCRSLLHYSVVLYYRMRYEQNLLCFIRNVSDNFDKVCTFSLYNFNYMGQIARPSSHRFSYYYFPYVL